MATEKQIQAKVNRTLRSYFLTNKKSYTQLLKEIKELKIQGANNVAFYGLVALFDFFISHKEQFKYHPFIKKLYTFRKKLFATRPTEPKLHNVIDYCILHLFDTTKAVSYNALYNHFYKNLKEIVREILTQKDKIVGNGTKVLTGKESLYTHCHSSSVIEIIKAAHKKKKDLVVHNTETRPRFQGRMTAKDLLEAGIRVNHYPDMGLRYALKNTDVVLLGCDSIDLKGVYNKIGSEIIAESANCFNVPLYICTSSLKFNFDCLGGEYTAIEERDAKEVWDFEHARLTVKNYAFERIHPSYITGVISDLGVHSFEDFLVHVIKKYNASEQSTKKE